MFIVVFVPELAVNVPTGVPFWLIVSVALFTVGIVGLFKISATPLVAFQSELTWAAGIGGVFVKSL